MSANFDYDDTLAAERSNNEAYLRRLQREQSRGTRRMATVGMPANVAWGGAGAQRAAKRSGALIGRVALDCEDPDLQDFYVAPSHVDNGRVLVVSWAAPLAGLLFQGRRWDASRVPDSRYAPDPTTLMGRRTFSTRGDDVVGFADDLEPGTTRTSVFRQRSEPPPISPPPLAGTPSEIPSAPGRPLRELPSREPPSRANIYSPDLFGGESPEGLHGDRTAVMKPELPQAPAADHARVPLERADHLVREEIDKPRESRLHSVLATLQPDQYRYVTWPATEHLVVQGHPGTGKTVIAAHRTAWLTDAEHDRQPTGHRRLNKVAFIGPSDEWKSHVSHVLDETGTAGYEVISLETLIRQLAETRIPSGTRRVHWSHKNRYQTDWDVSRLVKSAMTEHISRFEPHTKLPTKFDSIIRSMIHSSKIEDSYFRSYSETYRTWIQGAKNFHHARTEEKYMFLLACIGMMLRNRNSKPRYQHIVVDEVQDICGAEWWILNEMLRTAGTWSLFGDMNQRRAAVTWSTWSMLLDRLELTQPSAINHDTAVSTDLIYGPQMLSTGYRSNKAILKFASWLLPAASKGQQLTALRDGDSGSVRVVSVQDIELLDAVNLEAERLMNDLGDGTIAIISDSRTQGRKVSPPTSRGVRSYGRELHTSRRMGQEHLSPTNLERFERDRLVLMSPDRARGLEFDGVVVVEPADFPKVNQRHGLLYTSLTRANKKLVVVHSRPLPRELKGRA